jgi:hypothetical protein
MLKPNLNPPLENNLEVGMEVNGMGMCMLGILTDGVNDIGDVTQIEEPKKKGMDSEGPMELRDGKRDMVGMLVDELPLIPLENGIKGSATPDEAQGPNMVGGWLNN